MNKKFSKPLWQCTVGEFLELMSDNATGLPDKTHGRTVRGINNLATELGVSMPTVHKWKKEGKIPFSQVGRIIQFDLDQVHKAINGRKTEEIL